MDCKTISTFRSLEQQAIKQYQIDKIKETAYRGFFHVQEMPPQIPEQPLKTNEFVLEGLGKLLNFLA